MNEDENKSSIVQPYDNRILEKKLHCKHFRHQASLRNNYLSEISKLLGNILRTECYDSIFSFTFFIITMRAAFDLHALGVNGFIKFRL